MSDGIVPSPSPNLDPGEASTVMIADQMLLRLARWLRMAGLDVENPPPGGDEAILNLARSTDRAVITRDRGLYNACHRKGIRCYLIRSNELQRQLEEVSDLGFPLELNPQRCTLCNGPLVQRAAVHSFEISPSVTKDEERAIVHEEPSPEKEELKDNLAFTGDLSQGIRREVVWICTRCGHQYWQGSHWKGMAARISSVNKPRSSLP